MKKLFVFVGDLATIVFLLGTAVYFLWMEVGINFPANIMILTFQLMMVGSMGIIGTTLVRWVYKWPMTVSWFTLAFALTSSVGLIYSVRALLFIFGNDNSSLLMKVVLPALVTLLSFIATVAAIKWYRDRESQKTS